jgi:predicted GNAT family N-acyltransferase
MIRIIAFDYNEKTLFEQAANIRRKVFVEEQGVDPMLEYDNEEKANHYLVLYNEIPVGAARWRETDKGIQLERFAVLPEFRNRGIGTALLKEVLADVVPMVKKVYLHAQVRAMPFYERYGFVKEGVSFIEAGIKHFAMYLP